jgi:2,3-bisphosphoglycerate-dependent phosphoglycerate mutase
MPVNLKIDNISTELGSPSFVHAFFSTISFNLEKNGWGSRFPKMMGDFYNGNLKKTEATQAISELLIIKNELTKFLPSQIVWDIEDISKRPPWGDNISTDITNLSNYFITSTGNDLIRILLECLEYYNQHGSTCEMVS